MIINECQSLTDAYSTETILYELEKRYSGTLLCIEHTPQKKEYLLYNKGTTISLQFTTVFENRNIHYNINEEIKLTIPKLEKGFYIYNKNKQQELAYITKNAFRQWKRGICKNTYNIEAVTECLKHSNFFTRITNTEFFFQTIYLILKKKNPIFNKPINLKNYFINNNFILLSRDFVLLKSLNTEKTYDLLYHKYWVGHTYDLETLTIRDNRFKQEIYDLFNQNSFIKMKILC